jgi:hypothetical protein
MLLDTRHELMLAQVEANIEKLGRPQEVKMLLNSQAHFEHCDGLAPKRRQTRRSGQQG